MLRKKRIDMGYYGATGDELSMTDVLGTKPNPWLQGGQLGIGLLNTGLAYKNYGLAKDSFNLEKESWATKKKWYEDDIKTKDTSRRKISDAFR